MILDSDHPLELERCFESWDEARALWFDPFSGRQWHLETRDILPLPINAARDRSAATHMTGTYSPHSVRSTPQISPSVARARNAFITYGIRLSVP